MNRTHQGGETHEGMHGAEPGNRHAAHKGHNGREEMRAMEHGGHEMPGKHEGHGAAKGHGDHHAHMVADFRKRFWVSLIATVPILVLSPMIQSFLGFREALRFPGDLYVLWALSSIVFFYGGWPFLKGFFEELGNKQPAMMTLIAVAITTAYVYSSIVVFGLQGKVFFWELATLIDIMLLGHWIEMKSVMGASRALEELARLMPSDAHKIMPDGSTQDVPLDDLGTGDRVLVKPGEKVPVDDGFGAERHLDLVRRAKKSIGIPVIASLNGVSETGWVDFARNMQEAGADAIELNIYHIPSDLDYGGREVEQHYLDVLAAVKAEISIPVAVKIGPYFIAIGAMARSLAESGADALVLFNRFYKPDIDIVKLRFSMNLELSTPAEIRLPLLWIAILHGRVPASLAGSTGVDSAEDVFKYLLAGADAVMTTSSLLRRGVRHMRTLVDGLQALLTARGIGSIKEVRVLMSQTNLQNPTAFERANYVHILQGYHIAPAP